MTLLVDRVAKWTLSPLVCVKRLIDGRAIKCSFLTTGAVWEGASLAKVRAFRRHPRVLASFMISVSPPFGKVSSSLSGERQHANMESGGHQFRRLKAAWQPLRAPILPSILLHVQHLSRHRSSCGTLPLEGIGGRDERNVGRTRAHDAVPRADRLLARAVLKRAAVVRDDRLEALQRRGMDERVSRKRLTSQARPRQEGRTFSTLVTPEILTTMPVTGRASLPVLTLPSACDSSLRMLDVF